MSDSRSVLCPPVTLPKDKDVKGQAKGSAVKRKAEGLDKGENIKLIRLEEEETADGISEGRGNPQQSFLSNSSRSETASHSCPAEGEWSLSGMVPKDGGSSDSTGPRAQVPDIHRTGAKCVPGAEPDPLHAGGGYHQTGVLRVKPGRGEPTLSLSCSDKLARWGVLGFQGALLSHYLEEALYFTSVVVGKCPYSQEVMHRALVAR